MNRLYPHPHQGERTGERFRFRFRFRFRQQHFTNLLLISICLVLSLNLIRWPKLQNSLSSFSPNKNTVSELSEKSLSFSQQQQPLLSQPCGDWTPLGNLDNPHFNPTHVESLPGYRSCGATSRVGQIYEPPADELYCRPPLRYHRDPAVLGLDLQFHSNYDGNDKHQTIPDYSIVMPSFNVAEVLNISIPLLCEHTIGKWEVIFVLDQCYDNSLQVLHNILLSDVCQRSSLLRARVLMQPTGIFETSSDNLGFSLAHPSSRFLLEIQSDMLLGERGWNADMARPLLQYPDILAVSGRCGQSTKVNKTQLERRQKFYKLGRCNSNVGRYSEDMQQQDQNAVHICGTIIRGPIIFRAEAFRSLGFLDEVNFFLGNDDRDLARRALHKGWYVAYRYLHFRAPMDLSPRRQPESKSKMPGIATNQSHFYRKFRKEIKNPNCDPKIPFDSVAWDRLVLKPETRHLNPIPDGFDMSNLSALQRLLQTGLGITP